MESELKLPCKLTLKQSNKNAPMEDSDPNLADIAEQRKVIESEQESKRNMRTCVSKLPATLCKVMISSQNALNFGHEIRTQLIRRTGVVRFLNYTKKHAG